jgi:predicted O-methyltransferase YrrM
MGRTTYRRQGHGADSISRDATLLSKYEFTNDWFEQSARKTWDTLIPQLRPSRIVEVGSYEGASACYLIDTLSHAREIELHCIDNWTDGDPSYLGSSMSDVEARFRRNLDTATAAARHRVQLRTHKATSMHALATLIAEGRQDYFDFIYVDGSHVACDVLADATLCFALLRVGGVLTFDDYLWTEDARYPRDILQCPKPAIDAFINLNFRRLNVVAAPMGQLSIRKLAPIQLPHAPRVSCPPFLAAMS